MEKIVRKNDEIWTDLPTTTTNRKRQTNYLTVIFKKIICFSIRTSDMFPLMIVSPESKFEKCHMTKSNVNNVHLKKE